MAGSLQRIRKVQTSKVADFDDQLWPINCAILILAGFAVGIVMATSDFHEPNLLRNGWTRLLSVAVLVGLLFWGVGWLQGRMRRRLQLCVLIGLLIHIWLGIWAHKEYLAILAEQEAEATQQLVAQYEQITVPDYHWEQPQEAEARQNFEKPIETEAPTPTEPEAIRRQADEPEVPAETEPVEEPQVPQRQQPNPAVARRAELSAPRRADEAAGAQISRQEWKHRPRPNEPIPEPETVAQPRRTAAIPSAEIAPHGPRPTDVRIDQRQTFEELSSTRQQELDVKMARRATGAEPTDEAPTTPAPSRRVNLAAEIPRSEAAVPDPVKTVQRTRKIEPFPAATRMAARRQADAPNVVRPNAEPTPTPMAPPAAARAATRQRPAQQPPRLAQTPRVTPVRRPRERTIPSDMASPQIEAMLATARQVPPRVSPTPTQFPNRAQVSTATSPTRIAQRATTTSPLTESAVVAQIPSRRAQSPTEPSPLRRANRPTRTVLPEAVPQVAAARIAQPAVMAQSTPSDQLGLPTARPSTTAVSRAADRTARISQEQPPGRALPAFTPAAQLPAAVAARRQAAWQQQPGGVQVVPARPTTLARNDIGDSLPSTAIATELRGAATPAATGATAASRIRQIAPSAAVRREGARPPSGETIAAGGIAQIGVGSGQLFARIGQPRAAGIGQPSAIPNASGLRPARTPGSAASTAASGVPDAVTSAPGAVASTARGPSTPTFNVRSSTARRGGAARELAAQTAIGSGPAGPSGTAGAVGVAQQKPVTRYESIESAVAGSGAANPGKTVGGAASPSAAAEASTAVAAAAPSGGRATDAPPSRAPVSGPRRELTGLPGGLQSQPASGALASLTSEGAPLAVAIARRASASQTGPGGRDIAAARTVTMRSGPAGIDLPVANVPLEGVENVPRPGAGGVATARGGLPSILETGASATVLRAAADVAVGPATVPSGTAEFGLGAAQAVAAAGQARAIGDGLPVPAASAGTPEIGRSAASGAAIASAGSVQAEPVAERLAGGPGSEAGGPLHPGAGPARAAESQAVGRLGAIRPAVQAGSPAGPEGGAVLVARTGWTTRDDAVLAAAAGGAAIGPARSMGASRSSGLGAAAAELAEAGPSTGGSDAAGEFALQASLTGAPRRMAGLRGNLTDRTIIETAMQPGPAATTPGTARGPRRLPQGEAAGPSLAAAIGRGPVRRTDTPGLPRGVAEAIEEQPVAAGAVGQPGAAFAVADGIGIGEPGRQEGGLPVQIAAMAGPGGLSYDSSPDVGLPSRRARPESEIVHTVSRRFVIERSGGQLAIDGRVREQPTVAFQQRDVGRRAQAAQVYGGSEGTEKAVEIGLDFFARLQFPDGRWSLHELPQGVDSEDAALGQMKADSAATGLALLTYLGAGYTHLDDKHRAVVRRGLDWLVRNQKDNGDLFIDGKEGTTYAWFYSHGIATIALCEAYGMTRDPDLREPARKAIDFIVQTQHPTAGGWRYSLDEKGRATETDTSVTGWMLMALKSAQMAGLEVPDETLEEIDRWLDSAAARNAAGQYVYNPHAKDDPTQRHGRNPSLAMTAEAMLMRMYLGYQRDDPDLIAGADHLLDNLPAVGTPSQSLRDCYYWYYATQAMFQMQGDYWTVWNDRLRALVESSQVQRGTLAGSWHPSQPVEDRWGRQGGRLYVTSLHLLMLEVYYRHLPLFQELSR